MLGPESERMGYEHQMHFYFRLDNVGIVTRGTGGEECPETPVDHSNWSAGYHKYRKSRND